MSMLAEQIVDAVLTALAEVLVEGESPVSLERRAELIALVDVTLDEHGIPF